MTISITVEQKCSVCSETHRTRVDYLPNADVWGATTYCRTCGCTGYTTFEWNVLPITSISALHERRELAKAELAKLEVAIAKVAVMKEEADE